MDTSAYIDAVVRQTSTLAEWVDGKDGATPVPTTPKWTLTELVDHIGSVQRMVTMVVGERLAEPSTAFARYVPGPTDPSQWGAWLTEGAAEAKRAFESATDDTPVWDPSGAAAGVPFWSRRLFGEASVHRADAAVALGMRYELEPEHAVEAIEDWLDTLTSHAYWENRPDFAQGMAGDGQTLHFHTTDAPGDWLARREPDQVVLDRTSGNADVTVSGPAVDLLLVLSRRRPLAEAPGLDVRGDGALFGRWIDHMDWVSD